MSPRARRLLWLVIAVGVAARLIVAFKTYGFLYDMDSLVAVRRALTHHPLHVYSIVNGHPYNRWPYPPGFFPWILASSGLASVTGLPYHGFVQVAQIAADGVIAWLVQDHLGRRGAGERLRLAAASLVALGPSFAIISGYHGHFDSAAFLPAVLALWLWDRLEPGPGRALIAGVLIGVGATIKTVPVLMVFALLPSVRSRREVAALILPAIAIPVISLAPFVIADAHGTIHALRSHRALPGFGGISLAVQPGLAHQWLFHEPLRVSGVTHFLDVHEFALVAVLMAPFVALVLVRRTPPTEAAALLWCALPLLTIGFAFEYVIWALPFALMAGYAWQVAAVQAGLLLPTVIFEWHTFHPPPTGVYVAIMLAVWVGAVAAVLRLAVSVSRTRSAPAGAIPLRSPS